MPYNPKIVYKKGKDLTLADLLSRDCQPIEHLHNQEEVTIHILIPFSKTRQKEMVEFYAEDPDMIQMKKYINEGWPDSKKDLSSELQKYYSIKEELGIYNSVIVKAAKLLFPLR